MQAKKPNINPMEKKVRNPTTLGFVILVSLFLPGVCASSNDQSKHFVLVHGACLGAWSWYKMVPLLKSHGHSVTAIDLAASGINLLRANELRTMSDYTKPLMDFMESLPENEMVILVGHSYGGAAISQAMELFPHKITVAVFLTAFMPGPSLPFSLIFQQALSNVETALDNKVTFDDGPNNPPTTLIFGPNYISHVLYQHSPPEDAVLATMLVRPARLATGEELVFTEFRYGSVNRVFIISGGDQVLTKEIQEWMIEKNPPCRVLSIVGSDHMVMTSQPTQLLAHLPEEKDQFKANPMEENRRHPVILVLVILMSILFANVHASKEHNPKHFVLIHGACLGAWSWYKLIPPLKSYGHNVTAIDLAASGINLLRASDIRTFSDYSKPLMDFMESVPSTEKVILVGHSFGGAAISQAMELFPEKISVAVFVTASMPGPSLPLSEIVQKAINRIGSALDNKLNFDNGPNSPPTSFIFGAQYTTQVIYEFSPPQDPALAILLVRTVPLTSAEELVFTEARYGSVKRVFIIAEKDRVLTKEDQEWMIEKNPPSRVETISGSDHMVMTSKTPQLVAHLLDIARDFS
ncbi:hypothetical protein Cgig2_020078 [Carnegiea gigantea]|uniref:AB hydrolase-1 domain-containing protein n=1 Tax=Carnegiea gigantea TaxID=171969 RepID=A0A9Q1KFK5_9CARY|nr:hypothetical protein Cgig2_020078 [Carnegiea gigantea]